MGDFVLEDSRRGHETEGSEDEKDGSASEHDVSLKDSRFFSFVFICYVIIV